MHLWCRFYVSQPLFSEAQLDCLQSVIDGVLPQWSSGLRAAKHEDSQDGIAVKRGGRVFDFIHRVAAPKRGLGGAVLSGAYNDLSFFLHHSDQTLPPELNRPAIEVYKLSTMESSTTSAWAREAFDTIAARLSVRYAMAGGRFCPVCCFKKNWTPSQSAG